MINLSLEDVKGLQGKGDIAIIYRQYLFNRETPYSLYRRIKNERGSFLFESVSVGFYRENARFSFFGIAPRLTLLFRDGTVTYRQDGKSWTRRFERHPLDLIKEEMAAYKCANRESVDFPFVGGCVGYLGYDSVRYCEDVPIPAKDEVNLHEAVLCFHDYFFLHDYFDSTLKIVGHVSLHGDVEKNYRETLARLNELSALISKPCSNTPLIDYKYLFEGRTAMPVAGFRSNVTREVFEENVRKAIEYIRSGDAYQIVLSQRLSMPLSVDLDLVYEVMRSASPAPYMFFLDFVDYQLLGASPEVMVRVIKGKILVCPLAGTRPRGRDAAEDQKYEKELRESEKERAEHVMLVDLARNDVGRVAETGTVKVENLMHFLKLSHVQHLNSDVRATIREGKDMYDVAKSILPRGTLSGAPKIRAMEIIAELENDRRNHYGGGACYFSYSGDMDSAILIRTLLVKDGMAHVQAGAGVVADSDPRAEYDETINKAKAVLTSVATAEAIAKGNAETKP